MGRQRVAESECEYAVRSAGQAGRGFSRLRARRRLESSQAAFALVFSERLYTARRKICETTIQRGERFGAEWRPVVISGIAEVLEPPVREFRLIFR